jgi:hypothetical protein
MLSIVSLEVIGLNMVDFLENADPILTSELGFVSLSFFYM